MLWGCDMKPCDCKSMSDIEQLEEHRLKYNNESISVYSDCVLLGITPHVTIRLIRKNFKRFAEWYLTDQENNK